MAGLVTVEGSHRVDGQVDKLLQRIMLGTLTSENNVGLRVALAEMVSFACCV